MKHNKELKAYQKMLMLIMQLNEGSTGVHKVPMAIFLKGFNKYWNKYHAKEFRK